MLKIFMFFVVGIISGMWVWSFKIFNFWKIFFFNCFICWKFNFGGSGNIGYYLVLVIVMKFYYGFKVFLKFLGFRV